MKERITKAVFILALIIFLGALGYLGFIWFSYHSAEKGYEQLSEQVVQREEASPSGDGEETGNDVQHRHLQFQLRLPGPLFKGIRQL